VKFVSTGSVLQDAFIFTIASFTHLIGRALMALSSLLDSEATFAQQAEERGLSEPWVTSLKENGVATFAKLSFAITSPGTVATDDQVTRFLNNMRPGVVATIADSAAFKRVLFESQTLMIHRFKSAAKGDDTVPKKMSAPERDARLTRQRDQLRGLDITGPLEPAHGLYDLCAQMVERNEVAYISPSKCLSRQQELTGAKPEKELQLDASKTGLVIKEQPVTQEINLTSDLALYQAMQRRALAMDLTNLASYEVMEKWTDRMFAIFSQPAAPGFQKVSQAQLLRADRQAFIRLSETFNGSLKVMPMAGKPLDPMIERLESDVSVTYFMLPVPSQTGSSGSQGDANKVDKKRQETANADKPQPNKFQKGSKGKGKGKNKKREPVPSGLKGMHSRTPQGDQICYGYNLVTCKQGSACPRKHVCAVPGCYKNHPQTEHQ